MFSDSDEDDEEYSNGDLDDEEVLPSIISLNHYTQTQMYAMQLACYVIIGISVLSLALFSVLASYVPHN